MIIMAEIQAEEKSLNFLEEIVEEDLRSGKYKTILTRFPPEPNGHLHIGHAKSICLNFGLALKYGGKTNLRFDDTNPSKEEREYVDSIIEDVKWLGFNPERILYASDYFEELYQFAVKLIEKGLAYVDDSSSEEIASQKGTPTEPGIANKYRSRKVAENLQLFGDMRAGKYSDGEKVLRAKVDMTSPNMHMRDPIMYRIKKAYHHRTGNDWFIYPMYDFAHGQSDSIENITHSICTLEFIQHRPLYDWFIEKLEIFPSRQYEFARLNLTFTVMSKRKLGQLVDENYVKSWDDPRMPTISGLRRRGYTPESIRDFADRIGVQKRDNLIDVSLLEFCLREDLNRNARRKMVVFDPLKVVITNYPEQVEMLVSEDYPEGGEKTGSRELPFSRELYIEHEDFMENAPKKFFRLSPGKKVRLKSAYVIQCDKVIKDNEDKITELHCSYLPESKSGTDGSGLKVQGTLHWVSCAHAIPVELRLYDRLFKVENPAAEEGDFKEYINPDSLEIISAYAEPSLSDALHEEPYQFLRKGYFCLDKESSPQRPVFNRTVGLRDSWARGNKRS
jgi:glutaminyl-tRNA synthetase